MTLKVLLVHDNAPEHLLVVDLAHPSIQVEYLSNSATSLLQPRTHHSIQQLLHLLPRPQYLGSK
jgi:hypothetical protein